MDKTDIILFSLLILSAIGILATNVYIYFRPTVVTYRILPNQNIKFADIPLQEN